MRAILMAAGLGRRLQGNIEIPKCVLPIGKTTIIRHTVQMLIDNGIDVAVVEGYRKNDIRKALKDLPVTFFFNPFYRTTNNMASLWFAREYIAGKEPVIMANADVFWQQDILDELLVDKHEIVMLGDRTRGTTGDYCFELDENGYVNDFGKELSLNSRHTEYVGVAKIAPTFIKTFRELLDDAIEHEAYNLWWENVLYDNSILYPIFVHDISNHFWGEVDVMTDYKRIQEYCNAHLV